MAEAKKLSLLDKLLIIQSELKVEKSQYNTFGKYNYRSKEDILEAAKPLCHKHGLILKVDDSPLMIAPEYIYIVSTAVLQDAQTGESIEARGLAREPKEKKGMNASQITGTASSYAGKRALGNLFAIDDTKDADDPATQVQNQPLIAKCASCGKAYQFPSKAAFMDWVANGAESCCPAPSWKLS